MKTGEWVPISTEILAHKIDQGEILVVMENISVIGWLRYGYFWDNIPFMNMLNVMEGYRGQGIGKQLVTYWETMLRERGLPRSLLQPSQMNAVNSSIEGWVTRIVEPYFFLMNRSKLFYVRALLNTQASRQSEVSGRSARGIEQP